MKFIKSIAKYMLNGIGANYQVSSSHLDAVFEKVPDTTELSEVESQSSFMKNTNEPFMIGRWGTTEFGLLKHYLELIPWYEKKYNKKVSTRMKLHSGFFSNSKKMLDKYGKLYKKATINSDMMKLIGVNKEKEVLAYLCPRKRVIMSRKTRPWFNTCPWTEYLENRRVLVISPFKNDIKEQYKSRDKLFDDERILPKFDLKVVRAVNTRNKDSSKFEDWFEALNFMKEKIENKSFEIALLGCGSYGMPLCDFISENLNKTSIYMGGDLQLLFGLKGGRWEDQNRYQKIFNKYWKYPKDNVNDPPKLSKVSTYGKPNK
jgi:hypothetical protein